MIDIKRLKQLIQLMKENDLSELDLRDKEEQVTLRRGVSGPAAPIVHHAAPPAHAPAQVTEGKAAAEAPGHGLQEIRSPMVGTFYAAPSPDAEPFVGVGSRIDANTVVCVIEAMKVFNEIKAEVAGAIEKVLVANGEAVEFGQPLFLVKPA